MSCSRLLAVLVLGCCSLLARAETLVAIDNANPPFMYQQGDQPMGLYPLILQAVFARLGEPLEIQPMPWKRALLRGASGELGIAGIYKNTERLQRFDYSAPIFEERLLLYVQRERPLRFQRIEDLYGKRIGVIRGWSYTEEFDRAVRGGQIKAEEGSSDDANLRKLASSRLDAVIAIELAGQRLLSQPGLEHLEALPQPLSINPTFLVFAKQAAHQELLRRFDQTLQDMRQDGSLQRLIEQAVATP
ncbi:substrate-binding periplasmic protein [Pseudomonas sp. Gutcm_11s]|uniref:substrate-binding periplasmic protein n=1 Tax=Pseudomonas sp. Gutcm_11s TaxID=3026088 RepID=UPI002360FC30|nr:transporter substrate-binding domain-containing protein [Pseudomonas sp. Gutcm_11s]MDD0841689.1 transporter substrate-binding domain-containing protein [Pseudomonas sp. Gutcm_11s]